MRSPVIFKVRRSNPQILIRVIIANDPWISPSQQLCGTNFSYPPIIALNLISLFKIFIIIGLVGLVRFIEEVVLVLMVVTAATVRLFPAAHGLAVHL
jgi:hypothetical protein